MIAAVAFAVRAPATPETGTESPQPAPAADAAPTTDSPSTDSTGNGSHLSA